MRSAKRIGRWTVAEPLTVDQFPVTYRNKMIQAYPVIADMDADEFYFATAAEKDEAFARILNARNLQITHRMYLAGGAE